MYTHFSAESKKSKNYLSLHLYPLGDVLGDTNPEKRQKNACRQDGHKIFILLYIKNPPQARNLQENSIV